MSRGLIPILTVVAAVAVVWSTTASGPETVEAIHAQLDGQLAKSNRAFQAAASASGQRALSLAADSARSGGLVQAMDALARKGAGPDQPTLDAAVGAVATRAEKRGDGERAWVLGLANGKGAAESRLGEPARFGVPELPLADSALGGADKAGWASVDGQLVRLAAVPVGADERPAGALVLGYAVDDRFAERLEAETGAEVTVLAGDRVIASTLPASERSQLASVASRSGDGAFSFGPAPEGFSFLGMSLPFGGPEVGNVRAQAFPVPGSEGVRVVFSADAASALAPAAAAQQRGLWAGLLVLILGGAFSVAGFRATGGSKLRDLADAAEALVAGDLSTRAPDGLPGELGRIADALNRLFARKSVEAELANRAQAAEAAAAKILERHAASRPVERTPLPPPAPEPVLADTREEEAPAAAPGPDALPWDQSGLPPPPTPTPSPFDAAAASAPEEPASPPSFWDRPTQALSTEEAVAAARAAETDFESRGGAQEPESYNPEATVVAAVPEALLRATSRAPARPVASSPVPAHDPDEAHFEQVFRDFVATRERCGEPTDGLGFDKFAAKLRKNREQLIEKYHCRSVRFTVYVKEGRAALKATPIKE